MRKALLVAMLTLALGACATTAPPSVAKNTLPVRTSAPATTSRPPSPSKSASAAPSSAAPSFEKLPAGYTYAFLFKLTNVSGRWSVVLDPVTMCMYPSKDPACADITAPPANDYEIRNLSTKTFTVPLAAGTTVSVIGPSGQPDDYVVVPMEEKTWATSADGPQIIVTYATNAAGEVSQIKEWWHP
ncbi:MAG TPA: hypothetical protein VLS51_04240 [Propionibacteriaceae bacterium]|nr:hypothetical protein [Propionibacteriaceae bacterium]